MRASLNNNAEPTAQQYLSEREQQCENEDGLESSPGKILNNVRTGIRERRNQNQQRHDRQILKQQDAGDPASVFAFKFEFFCQQLEHDGRGRHGQCAAESKRGAPTNIEDLWQKFGKQTAAQHRDKNSHHHLRHTQTEHIASHGLKFGQGELEADGKHQKDHTELGQHVRSRTIRCQAQGMRANQNAHR